MMKPDSRYKVSNDAELRSLHAELAVIVEFHALSFTAANIRAQREPERHATDNAERFDAMTRYVEPPSDDEGFDVCPYP